MTILVCAGCSEPPVRRPIQSFAVAIAGNHEGGSHLEPIARFNGTSWVNDWPAPASSPPPKLGEIPEVWLDGPVSPEWNVWSFAGKTQKARIVGTRRGDQCEALIQLDLAPGMQFGSDPLEARVAVDVDQRVDVLQPVTDVDPEMEALSLTIRETYAANQKLAFDPRESIGREISEEDLMSLPVRIEYLTRSESMEIAELYYFAATKSFNSEVRPRLGVVVSGWLRRETDGNLVAFEVRSRGFGGERGPALNQIPLASFEIAGHEYFLMDIHGYEGSAAKIVEFTSGKLVPVLDIPRGGC